MTRQWYLSEQVSRGLDLVSVCTDTLFAIEQASLPPAKRYLEEERIRESLKAGLAMIARLKETVEAEIGPQPLKDNFLFYIVESLRKELNLTPKDLLARLTKAEMEVAESKASKGTMELFEKLCQKTTSFASEKVESLSEALRP